MRFERVWRRIETHAGETFRQTRGGEFTYGARSGAVWPNRTTRAIPRSHFEQAFALVPLPSTTPLQRLQGSSYLYAILMDSRIRGDDW
ncbi:MAG: hypothetical protein M3N52_04530 [Actinomycetota bacterium]|nr:hypothetical protein [Actinomycetota bacterium]